METDNQQAKEMNKNQLSETILEVCQLVPK
jgi:hypothetical protein